MGGLCILHFDESHADEKFEPVQDPAYNNPGVPLDRGIYNSFAETFEDKDKMHGQASEIDCNIQVVNAMANREDCSAAIATGMLTPIVGLLAGRKGGQWWASVSGLLTDNTMSY
jgi:hypothetical protein